MRSIPVLWLFLASTTHAQYQGPESVEHDPAGERYFVSNTQSASIKVRQMDGTVTDFVTGMDSAPYGLEIMGDVLYACTGNGVRGYALADGSEVYHRDLGALFPNGITTDNQYLFITDFSGNARRIYKVDPVQDTHSVLVANTGGQPNGIVWDEEGQRLVTVFWGGNAPIKAYDRDTGAETVLLAASGLGNNDGITIDCNGDFLVSSWSPQRISRFEPSFTQPAENLGAMDLSNPADIDFDHSAQRICIPNSGNNTVQLMDLGADCVSASMDEGPIRTISLIVEHAAGSLQFAPALERPSAFLIVDMRGMVVGRGTIQPHRPLSISNLAAGYYALLLPELRANLRFMKP